jgi:hypothetical protein
LTFITVLFLECFQSIPNASPSAHDGRSRRTRPCSRISMYPKETEGLSTRLCPREQVVLSRVSPSDWHLLNVGLGSAEALDPVESWRDSDVLHLLNVGLGSAEALDPVESWRDSDVLHLLNVGLGSAEALDPVESWRDSDVLHLLNVGLGSAEALDPLESSRDNDVLLLSSFPNLILRVCAFSLVVGEQKLNSVVSVFRNRRGLFSPLTVKICFEVNYDVFLIGKLKGQICFFTVSE